MMNRLRLRMLQMYGKIHTALVTIIVRTAYDVSLCPAPIVALVVVPGLSA